MLVIMLDMNNEKQNPQKPQTYEEAQQVHAEVVSMDDVNSPDNIDQEIADMNTAVDDKAAEYAKAGVPQESKQADILPQPQDKHRAGLRASRL